MNKIRIQKIKSGNESGFLPVSVFAARYMLKTLILLILILSSSFTVSYAQKKKTKIFVLSALHQLHEQTKFYSFEMLSQIIEKQKPDVLAVELTPADLQTRRE